MHESDALSAMQAYRAMFRFLVAYYERTNSDEIAGLLGDLAINEDGQPMDPAAWTDWLAAIENAGGGRGAGRT